MTPETPIGAAELREIRARLGWTQSQLAQLLQITRAQLSWLEAGARTVDGEPRPYGPVRGARAKLLRVLDTDRKARDAAAVLLERLER